MKSFHWRGGREKIDRMDVGRFARFLANDIKDPDDDKRKIDNDLKLEKFTFFLTFLSQSLLEWRTAKQHGELIRKRSFLIEIYAFFFALLSLATFMLSINFHFLLFGHSCYCLSIEPRFERHIKRYRFISLLTLHLNFYGSLADIL